jgi:glycosyltransferase involved in cell wall biosynthesis
MSELISIIVPTRNRCAALAQCLEAIGAEAAGTHPCELLVVDDCSTDRTPEVVEAFARAGKLPVRLLRHPHPRGANAARNRALDEARGEIIIFLDDDVLVPPGWLEKLLRGFAATGCPVVTGAVKVTTNGNLVGKHREEIQAYLGEVLSPPAGVRGETVPIACNMAALRSSFDRARFDETLRPPMEEIDWLRRAGVAAGFVPEAWVWHCKAGDELRLERILRGAWRRGGEGGWWMRERLELPSRERQALAWLGAKNCVRGLGHALLRGCWGGVVIGAGELSKALALMGLTHRGDRRAESWR